MEPSSLAATLVNAGIAGVFAIFALTIFDKLVKFITHQNEVWRDFTRTEQDRRHSMWSQTNENLRQLSNQLAHLDDTVAASKATTQALEEALRTKGLIIKE